MQGEATRIPACNTCLPSWRACMPQLLVTHKLQEESIATKPNTVQSAHCSLLLLKQTLWISINNLFSISCSFWFSKSLPFTICFPFIFTLHLRFYFPRFTLQSFIVLLFLAQVPILQTVSAHIPSMVPEIHNLKAKGSSHPEITTSAKCYLWTVMTWFTWQNKQMEF